MANLKHKGNIMIASLLHTKKDLNVVSGDIRMITFVLLQDTDVFYIRLDKLK